jgi:hypothetical protein
MNKEQAEQILRAVLSQINLPLAKHQELQNAVTVLAMSNKGESNLKELKKEEAHFGVSP